MGCRHGGRQSGGDGRPWRGDNDHATVTMARRQRPWRGVATATTVARQRRPWRGDGDHGEATATMARRQRPSGADDDHGVATATPSRQRRRSALHAQLNSTRRTCVRVSLSFKSSSQGLHSRPAKVFMVVQPRSSRSSSQGLHCRSGACLPTTHGVQPMHRTPAHHSHAGPPLTPAPYMDPSSTEWVRGCARAASSPGPEARARAG